MNKYKIKSGVKGTHFGFTGQKIVELRKKGLSYKEIQDLIGCSKSTISYWCSQGRDINSQADEKVQDHNTRI